jgi:hypothetical protein
MEEQDEQAGGVACRPVLPRRLYGYRGTRDGAGTGWIS